MNARPHHPGITIQPPRSRAPWSLSTAAVQVPSSIPHETRHGKSHRPLWTLGFHPRWFCLARDGESWPRERGDPEVGMHGWIRNLKFWGPITIVEEGCPDRGVIDFYTKLRFANTTLTSTTSMGLITWIGSTTSSMGSTTWTGSERARTQLGC